MPEKPPKLSIEGKRFNLVLSPSFMAKEMVEMQRHYDLKDNTAVARFALQELYQRMDNPSASAADRLGRIGLIGVIEDSQSHDFTDLIRQSESMTIHVRDYERFRHMHKHGNAIASRLICGLSTKLIFASPTSATAKIMIEELVSQVAQFDYLEDRGRTLITEHRKPEILPTLSILTESVLIETPYSALGKDPSFALVWDADSELAASRASDFNLHVFDAWEKVLLNIEPKGVPPTSL